ncbi:MAG: transglycosylase domain-containing protein [Clostridia bacterium]|nr:transglycosylase domain-containing protein [Clostridia bacterium]
MKRRGNILNYFAILVDDNFKKILSKLLKSFFIIFTSITFFIMTTGIVYLFKVANEVVEYDVKASKMHLSSIIYELDENDGEYKEATRAYDIENRIWVNFENIPNYMKDAIIAIEDKRFYEHRGVDWKRTTGAAINLFFNSNTYGGSTLTQQLIKNLTEENEVSLTRKIKEICRALNFEKKWSKDEILEAYLNVVHFGSGCYGVQAAANKYFGKDIEDCSIAECAAIAGITQNPTLFNPFLHPVNNRKRRETVLSEMFSQAKITQSEYNKAMEESKCMAFRNANAKDSNRPEFVRDWYTEALINDVINDLSAKYKLSKSAAQKMVYTQGLQIYSCVDRKAQKIAEDVIYRSDTLEGDKKLELGYLMMDFDGKILATIGSRAQKTANSLFDRANYAKRQPGSAIKPISVYAPAIDLGLYDYHSTLPDSPLENFFGPGKPGPRNWYGGYKGTVSLQWAVEQSANAPAVQALRKLTNKKSYDFLKEKLGMRSLTEADLSSMPALALGGLNIGVTVREMVAAYQIFGNGGIYNKPYTYLYVLDRNGKVLLDNRDNIGIRAISSKTATVMNRLLRNVITSGTGKAANIPNWDIVGKTGSTNSSKDSWIIAMSPYAVAGIWTGYNLPKKLSSTVYSKLVWKEIMSKYLADKENKDYSFDDDAMKEIDPEAMNKEEDVETFKVMESANTDTRENNEVDFEFSPE